MSKIFDKVKKPKVRRTAFDLSHEKKMSFQMGKLQPLMVQEVVPGDTFKVDAELFIRMAPMIAPIMHRVNVYTHFFFVPNRLIYNDWTKIITGDLEQLLPYFDLTHEEEFLKKGSLAEAFGLPNYDGDMEDLPEAKISKLPFRAYNLIYNEYYRDQNLTPEVDLDSNKVLYRAWEKDYFTSALPFAQKGGEATVPLDATVNYLDDPTVFNQVGAVTGTVSATPINTYESKLTAGGNEFEIRNVESVEGTISINQLRLAERLQRWLETNARAGSRYVEHLLGHWGVRSSDASLQRPQYLGGGKSNMNISEVLSTANAITSESVEIPQGNMSGHGASVGKTNSFSRFFEEHGYIIGIVSVMPRTAYQQGIHRMWSRLDKFDFYFPEFAHLGEQEVKNKELFYDPNQVDADGTFGYQSRWSEYKYQNSLVTGDFRDNLAHWHMGRIFGSLPALNHEFVTAENITKRIFAVEDPELDDLWAHAFIKINAIRPMPYFATPRL